MKKVLVFVSTSFILLIFIPSIFGAPHWKQNFNEHHNNAGEDAKDEFSPISHHEHKVFEDSILLIDDESPFSQFHDLPEIDLEYWSASGFASVLTQRPTSEKTKIISQPSVFRDFTTLKLRSFIENGQISLFDQYGNLAFQQKFDGSEFELKRNDLKSGIYFFKISENETAINSGKIVVN